MLLLLSNQKQMKLFAAHSGGAAIKPALCKMPLLLLVQTLHNHVSFTNKHL